MKSLPHAWNTCKQPETAPNTTVQFIAVGVVMFLCILIALFVSIRKLEQQPPPPAEKSISIPKRDRTDAEMKEFWNRELQELIGEQLPNSKLPYPEINERFANLNQIIVENTKAPLAIYRLTNYSWASTDVVAAAGVDTSNNTRHVALYLPAIMDTFDMLRDSGETNWHAAFRSHILVVFMHEMEHTTDVRPQWSIDINEESRAWAETCRHTIVPLAESHHVTLFQNEWKVYRAWKLANGDTGNTNWSSTMRRLYGKLDGKVQPK